MKIFKYPFEIKERFSIEMPAGADILTVQNQREVGTMWALTDPTEKMEKRNFAIVGTGHEFDPQQGFEYIGTFQMLGGVMVWHVFELT